MQPTISSCLLSVLGSAVGIARCCSVEPVRVSHTIGLEPPRSRRKTCIDFDKACSSAHIAFSWGSGVAECPLVPGWFSSQPLTLLADRPRRRLSQANMFAFVRWRNNILAPWWRQNLNLHLGAHNARRWDEAAGFSQVPFLDPLVMMQSLLIG
jgi:hypothetical protein